MSQHLLHHPPLVHSRWVRILLLREVLIIEQEDDMYPRDHLITAFRNVVKPPPNLVDGGVVVRGISTYCKFIPGLEVWVDMMIHNIPESLTYIDITDCFPPFDEEEFDRLAISSTCITNVLTPRAKLVPLTTVPPSVVYTISATSLSPPVADSAIILSCLNGC